MKELKKKNIGGPVVVLFSDRPILIEHFYGKLKKKPFFAIEGDYFSISINKSITRDKSKKIIKLFGNKFEILAVTIHGDYTFSRISFC